MTVWIYFAGFFLAGGFFGYGLCLCIEPVGEEEQCED